MARYDRMQQFRPSGRYEQDFGPGWQGYYGGRSHYWEPGWPVRGGYGGDFGPRPRRYDERYGSYGRSPGYDASYAGRRLAQGWGFYSGGNAPRQSPRGYDRGYSRGYDRGW